MAKTKPATGKKTGKKINRLYIKNYNSISEVEIIPTESTVTLSGKNGQGKTSVLRAIESIVFGGHIEEPVVRSGETNAQIIAEIDDYVLKWDKTVTGVPRIEVRGKDGNKVGGTRRIVSDILGAKLLTDPLSLVDEKDGKKQRRLFLDLLGIDTKSLDESENYRREKRRDIGRDIKNIKGRMSKLSYNPDVKRVNIVELTDQLNGLNKQNAELETKQSDLITRRTKYKAKRAEILKLQDEADTLKAEGVALEQELKDVTPVDTSIIKDQIKKAEGVNELARDNADYEKERAELEEKEREYTERTDEIQAIIKERDGLLLSANLPDIGLTFSNDAVLYHDLPLKKASTGEKIKLGFEFLRSLDPEFKVLWIEDGDKLDADNLELIKELSYDSGIQVWIERVGKVNAPDAVYLEGGKVVSKDNTDGDNKGGDNGKGKD